MEENALEIGATTKILFDRCVETDYTKRGGVQNELMDCFAAYDVGSCFICDKGFSKNKKGLCVKIVAP